MYKTVAVNYGILLKKNFDARSSHHFSARLIQDLRLDVSKSSGALVLLVICKLTAVS